MPEDKASIPPLPLQKVACQRHHSTPSCQERSGQRGVLVHPSQVATGPLCVGRRRAIIWVAGAC
eukprot:6181838-Karenia_brevis.AAC.1